MGAVHHVRGSPFAPKASAVGHKKLPVLVKIQTPWIACPVRENFKAMRDRIVSPYACGKLHSVLIQRARLTYRRAIEDTLGTVEPPVGPPDQTVKRLVGIPETESIEQDFGGSIGPIVQVAIGDEKQFGCCSDPNSTVSDLDPTGQVQSFDKYLAFLKPAVSIGVGEDHNPIEPLPLGSLLWVRVTFENPQSAARVEGKGDRLMDLWLGCDQIDREPIGHKHLSEGLVR
jgi:hypothetical protein